MPHSSSRESSDGEPKEVQDSRHRQPVSTSASSGANHVEEASSPTDGYFRGRLPPFLYDTRRVTVSVPRVPNVWVDDPSLELDEHIIDGDNKSTPATVSSKRSPTNSQHQAHNFSTSDPVDATDPDSAQSRRPDSYNWTGQHRYPPSTKRLSPIGIAHDHRRGFPLSVGNDDRSSLWSHLSEAPPAYTSSPATPLRQRPFGYRTFQTTYHTFPNPAIMGRLGEEGQGLLAGEGQSMGDPRQQYRAHRFPAWRDRARKRLRLRYMNFRSCKTIIFCVVLMLLFSGFLSSFFESVLRQRRKDLNGFDPAKDYPDLDRPKRFKWDNPQCSAGSGEKNEEWEWLKVVKFDHGRSFKFSQDVSLREETVIITPEGKTLPPEIQVGKEVHVYGDFIIRRSDEINTPGPRLIVTFVTNDHRVGMPKLYDAGQQLPDIMNQEYRVTVPREIPLKKWESDKKQPCMRIRGTLWVPGGAVLDNVTIDTSHMGTKLLDDLSFSVNKSSFYSTVGTIISGTDTSKETSSGRLMHGAPASYQFKSRSIEVKTVSASISGAWPLYDNLTLESQSGRIYVGIEPKAANATDPKPARLHVMNTAGDIELSGSAAQVQKTLDTMRRQSEKSPPAELAGMVTLAKTLIPPRDYRVNVSTTSGSIKGAVAFSTSANFQSTSADMTLQLLPVLDSSMINAGPNDYSKLTTNSVSGKLDLTVTEPMWVNVTGGPFEPPPKHKGPAGPPAPHESEPMHPMPMNPDSDKHAVDKSKTDSDKPKIESDKSKTDSDKPKTDSDKSKTDTDKPKTDAEKPKTNSEKTNTDSDKAKKTPTEPVAGGADSNEPPKDSPKAPLERRHWEHLLRKGTPLRVLQSKHHTSSANVKVRYPGSWEGSLGMESTTGKLSLRGKGIEVVDSGGEFRGVDSHMAAQKGLDPEKGSDLEITTTSGSVDILIGEEPL